MKLNASAKQLHGTIVNRYAGVAADKSVDDAGIRKGHILNGTGLVWSESATR